jgi:DNA-binding beta-propeller fold protein YncE
MKIAFSCALIFVAALGFGAPRPADSPADALLILSKTNQTLAIVNPANLQVLARVPVGSDPHEVIASSDGKFAYVSNYGSGAYDTLAVVDLVAQKALPSIDLGAMRGPHGLTYVGGKLWFTAEASKAIGRFDPATQSIDWIFGTGQNRTHMIYVFPDMQRILTTNVNSATVSVIEKVAGTAPAPGRGAPGGDWNQTVIPVGPGSEGFDVSPDGREAWVANAGDGSISIINAAAKRVTETLALDLRGANRLKFTRDGKYVFVAGQSGTNHTALTVIDAATHQVAKKIDVGRGAAGIVMQPDGARAFVACSPENNVVAINLATLEVVGRIDAGGNPDGMAWATRH